MSAGRQPMVIRAPVSGVVVPLESVPDPVFSRRMMGEGVAIDPTAEEVVAPIAGTVTQLHDAHHALAIRTDDGVEVLVHVGLDTVALGGRGFTALVQRGARVACGAPVLRFDAEALAREARSLLTVVLVTSGERLRSAPAKGLVEGGVTALLEVEAAEPGNAPETRAGEAVVSHPIVLPNAAGLHARPAAVLAQVAKRFSASVRLTRGADEANAKSVVAVMGLSTRAGDSVRVVAEGPDAQEAVEALSGLLASGCGERPGEAPDPGAAAPAARAVEALRAAAVHGELFGAPASPGLASGRVFQHRHASISVREAGGAPEEERARFGAALREAARQIEALRRHSTDRVKAQILEVHLVLLEDPELLEATEAGVAAGKSAAFAWQAAFTAHAARLQQLDSPILRERASDVRDVGRRLLALLAGVGEASVTLPEDAILVAEELSPSDTAAFEKTKLLGFCTTRGGSTSHVAILARSMGIPAVCGIDESALGLADGTRVVLDGTKGLLRVNPDESYVSEIRERILRQAARGAADEANAFATARTRDGHRVEVVANVRNAADARAAVEAGAEGVGLLRSEFLFADREDAPDEEEQAAAYAAVAAVLGKERPFVVRTLDVGGDKPLPYLPLPQEDNPFLGLRGIRVSLANPELFRTQLRAILRAAPLGNLHVMFPMIATLDEVRAAKEILAEEQRVVSHAIKVGVMIEVPSAAITAEVLAREVDFFSIGTNDLTQYTLAMDRGHPQLARHADALHPAVLRMMAMTIEGAHEHGKWVGVCGGIASDPLAVPVLVGLGVDELSVDVPAVKTVKATLARWSFEECAELATDVLRLRSATEVRTVLAAYGDGEGRLEPKRFSA